MNTQQIVQLPIYVLNKCCFAATTGRVNERMALRACNVLVVIELAVLDHFL